MGRKNRKRKNRRNQQRQQQHRDEIVLKKSKREREEVDDEEQEATITPEAEIRASREKKRTGQSKHDLARSWVSSQDAAKSWLAKKYDLIKLVEENGGLVKIRNFFPSHVADYALDLLKRLPSSRWSVREDDASDPTSNSIKHHFLVANPNRKFGDELTLLTDLIESLLPEKRAVFSAAKYMSGDFIEDHDDHAYLDHVDEKRGETKAVFCSRDIAVILYLTKDWRVEDGGILTDCVTGNTYVPEFNSMIAFAVPRFS